MKTTAHGSRDFQKMLWANTKDFIPDWGVINKKRKEKVFFKKDGNNNTPQLFLSNVKDFNFSIWDQL